ncbi:MAG: hypothetical protein JNL70_09235 [Saprospiraceae bacterium]|nr:hypothetical protein [Saprospiraceae bacterium]
MSIQEYQEGLKSKVASWHLGRKLIWAGVIVLLFFIAYAAFYIYYPYSEGTRTGYIRKLSHKGMVFKTWEGELQMPGITSAADGNQMVTGGNIWLFSVKRGEDEVVKGLQEAEATNQRVTLHYVQYLKQFQWRGETVYFIDKVTKQN